VVADVLPSLLPGVDLILGNDWLREHGARLDFDSTKVCTVRNPHNRSRRVHLTPVTLSEVSSGGACNADAAAALVKYCVQRLISAYSVPTLMTAK
jgi:hypothetical protein